MTDSALAVVILAAGLGTRMKSDLPKVLHPLAGRPMLSHLLETIAALAPARTVVVTGPGMETVAAAAAPHPTVIQEERLGTGHAVKTALPCLEGFTGDVLVVYGDTPLLSAPTLRRLSAARREGADPAVVVLGFRDPRENQYGRLVLGEDGSLAAIVEWGDATPAERALPLCNSGVIAVDGKVLPALLDRLDRNNAKSEYYLTDIAAGARALGRVCLAVEGTAEELAGVNSRVELAAAEAVVQDRLRRRAMEDGATLIDPRSVTFCFDTVLGRDVVVGPHVVFGSGVTIGDRVDIRPFCHLEGATVAAGAVIGPFARLRPGAVIASSAHIGNFVEIKQATIERGAKVNHLTYIGDAHIGEKANIGAGTITCNYDGFTKSRTEIGAGAFIGSNTALVAPVAIGEGAIVGAGSVITRDVPADALSLNRAPRKDIVGWARRFRHRKTEK